MMKINEAIKQLLAKLDISNQELSDMISADKTVNIADKLSYDNMTIKTILKLITPLGYNLILQPSTIEKKAYQIPVDLSETCVKIRKPLPINSVLIRRTVFNGQIWYCLEDVCSCIGAKTIDVFEYLPKSHKKLLIGTVNGNLQTLHLITRQGMISAIKHFTVDYSQFLFENDSLFTDLNIIENNQEKTFLEYLLNFIQECCIVDMEVSVSSTVLYSKYLEWCEQCKIRSIDKKYFEDYFNNKFTKNGNIYFGVGIIK